MDSFHPDKLRSARRNQAPALTREEIAHRLRELGAMSRNLAVSIKGDQDLAAAQRELDEELQAEADSLAAVVELQINLPDQTGRMAA